MFQVDLVWSLSQNNPFISLVINKRLAIISFHRLPFVVELNLELQINNCKRWVILLSLCSSWFRKELSGWFSFKGNLCNQRFLYCWKIKSNAYNSELYCAPKDILWVAALTLADSELCGAWSRSAPVCASSCCTSGSSIPGKRRWDAWAPFLFKALPNECRGVGFEPWFALLRRGFLHG